MDKLKLFLNKLETFKNLPSLPQLLLTLIDACNQDMGSAKEISDIVGKDPSLSLKILRLVNSAYYGLPQKIENMNQAVTLVGTDAVRNIAICASVYEAFRQTKDNEIINLKLFWWHSLKCAVLSRIIAENIHYKPPDEAFLSGLLHDIGRLVLWINFPEKYENLLKIHKDRHELLLAGEARIGATHSEVGAWLLRRWNLQSFMADSVLYHHEPAERMLNALPLVQIVNVANALCHTPVPEKSLKNAQEIFGFNPTDIEAFLSQSDIEAKEVAQSLHIAIEQPKDVEIPPSENDLKKKKDLLSEVKYFSLLQGALQNIFTADDLDAILKVIYEGLHILFDVNNIFFFLHDRIKTGLLGKTAVRDNKLSMINDLIIPLQAKQSILVKTFFQEDILDSFTLSTHEPLIVLDEQIIRLIGTDGILCLPMKAHGEPIGIIIIGVNQFEFSFLSKQHKLLTLFSNQAAQAIHVANLRLYQIETIKSERLNASTALARKVLHEVNNPLSIIKNYLKIIDVKLSKKIIAQDEVRIINEEIDRVSEILSQLDTFAAERAPKNERVDINVLLSDLVKITKESLLKDSKIRIHLDLESSIPHVMAEKNGLKQVFINLLQNASEAMSEGGDLRIQTRPIYTPIGEHVKNRASAGYIEIAFDDDGKGIPNDIESRLFEPYVSSKSKEHPGLGLSIVHNIVKKLNGNITYKNKKERGAVFKIELPVLK